MTTSAESRAAAGRRFGRHALVYFVSYVLVRGLTFLLTPLYTRSMSPDDFAIIAVANTLTTVLSIMVGAGLYGAIPRLLHDYAPGPERRRFLGTVFVFSVLFPLACGVVLQVLGSLGLLDFFETVRFHPHLQLVIWTAVLSNLSTLPSTVYITTEQPRKVTFLNVVSGVVQIAFTVVLVTGLKQGALGVLRAACMSAGLMAAISAVLMVRMSEITLARPILSGALIYALPLVPHLLASWALSVSDRLVLEKYVSPADLGRYSLGYTLSIAVSLVAAAVVTPLTATANRQLGDPEKAHEVPAIGTLALLATVISALLACVSRRELIRLLAPSSYADAAMVVPWVVAGAAFQGVYLVWSTGTWYSKKTAAIPLVTLASVVVNVGLNLCFVPRYGVIAAGVSTTVGYVVSAGLHGWLAQRNHPIPWEYRRWAAMAVAALASYAAIQHMRFESVLIAIVLKSVLCLLVFAVGLAVLGFFKRDELVRAWALVRQRVP